MKRLNDKFMTDEETDNDSENGFLIRRSPKWRHDRLTQLFSKLDKKYKRFSKSDKSRPLKPRKPGHFTERKPPINAPKWALNDVSHEETSKSVGELPDLTNYESESSLTSTSDDGKAGSMYTPVTAGNCDTVMVSK